MTLQQKQWIPFTDPDYRSETCDDCDYFFWGVPGDLAPVPGDTVASMWCSIEVEHEWMISRVYVTEFPVQLIQIFEEAYIYHRQFWPKGTTPIQEMLDWASDKVISPMELLAHAL